MKLPTPPRQPFMGLALMAMTGIIVAEIFPLRPTALLPTAIIFAMCILLAIFRPRLAATYFIVAAGFFLLHKFANTNTEGQRLAQQLGDRLRVVTATGYVITDPKIAPSGFATFLLKLSSIEFEGRKQSTGAIWQVRWKGAPEFGDELKLFGNAETIAPPRNPGEFDMRSYLARNDVRRMLFVRYPEDGAVIRHGSGNPVLRAAQKSRSWMQNALCRGLENSPEVQTFLSGIVLGLRHQAPEDIEEPFQQTGTLHLFAVAGLHIGIVATLLWMLATLARLSRKTAAAIIIPLLFFYAAVTGLHVSSLRAATMASILVGGLFFERRVFLANSLAAAAFFILCWNTNELFSTGFQLSFAVVGAIVFFAGPFFKFLQRRSPTDPFLPESLLRGPRRWVDSAYSWLCGGASVSLAAWVGSLPLMLWYFHLVTPVSLIANLVVIPIAFFVLAIALLSLAATPLLPWLAVVFNNANWTLATLVIGIVNVFAQIPGGHFYVAPLDWNKKSLARMTVLDLGAGAAVHLRTTDGNWLFDCGSQRAYERGVRDYLHWSGINRLSALFLTHGDSLHIGGAMELLNNFPNTQVFDNPAPDRSALHRQVSRMLLELKNSGFRCSSLIAGDTLQLAHGVTARVLFPPSGFAGINADDQTFVVRVSIAPRTFVLLMSDSGEETERALLNNGLELHSDIVIKGQHHSAASGSAAFLDAVRPQLIIATSQDFPEHERISENWADQVRARGIKLFRQDETGAVELTFRENEWTARAYLTEEIFRSVSR